MECEENGGGVKAVAGRRGVKRKRQAGGATAARPPAPRAPAPALTPAHPQPALFPPPFLNMNLMEEITFWICTRRAPCLYRYNNVYKKKIEEAHCSNKPGSEPSYIDEVTSPKKKKRKLQLLGDDDSVSSEKQQNVYFEKPHKQYWYSSSESEPDDRFDVDFNINSSYIRNKKTKSQRRNRTNTHRKNKIITSTPKPTTLRRSLRKTQQNLSNNHLNCSFDIINANAMNGEHQLQQGENCDDKSKSRYKSHTSNSKKGTILKEQSKNEIMHNGQFEDISDVSGFTANYIRSTKMNSKSPRKVRGKPSRNLAKESQQKLGKDESKIIVCINKSVGGGLPAPVLNQNTESQNVINLVTVNNNNNGKTLKVNRSASQLKYLDIKDDPIKDTEKDAKRLHISFQSKSSGVSRYPSRHRNNSKVVNQDFDNSNKDPTSIKKKVTRCSRELKSINQNENADVTMVSRTRSGRKIGVIDLEESQQSQDQPNVEEPTEPCGTKAGTPNKSVGRKKRAVTKKTVDKADLIKDSESDKDPCAPSSSSPAKCVGKKVGDRTRSFRKDVVRDKSGFADCFSDSDEDKPLIRRKFFC